jgi:hypothetical protein
MAGTIKKTITSTFNSTQANNQGYNIPLSIVQTQKDSAECFECLITDNGNGRTFCKSLGPCATSTPPPAPPPTTGTTTPPTPPTPPSTGTTGGGVTINPAAKTALERMYHKLNLHVNAKDPDLDKEFKDLRKELRGRGNNGMYMSKMLRVQWEPNPDNAPERIVMWGRDTLDRNKIFEVGKNDDGEWGWLNTEVDPNGEWTPFEAYNPNLNEDMGLLNILKEENESLSEMIDHKLREFNFYTADGKGKQRVVFTDDDREEISKEFDDLIKKYPEDIAFIRAVVIAKGEDKKTGEPVVRLGSYYNNANIELPFNSQMNGLGKLLDGGIVYFTILNNEGPDYRDFKIVGGDKIPDVDFNDKEKEEIETDTYVNTHNQEMEKTEPFEEVMKEKEKKGLQSLLDGEGLTNELTKRQKEILENLKKKGFKFEKPENADIYERVRINSEEFNESINAWRPKE